MIQGKGFVAGVAMRGNVLLTDEGDGDVWLYGVQPGGIAGGGSDKNEAFIQYRQNYINVLTDIAETAESFADFDSQVKAMFNDINLPNQAEWNKALKEVRENKLNLDIPSVDANRCPPGIDIVNLSQQNSVSKVEVTPEMVCQSNNPGEIASSTFQKAA